MSRYVLESSTAPSSTSANIRKFIKETDLSDYNQSGSTLPSTAPSFNKNSEEKGKDGGLREEGRGGGDLGVNELKDVNGEQPSWNGVEILGGTNLRPNEMYGKLEIMNRGNDEDSKKGMKFSPHDLLKDDEGTLSGHFSNTGGSIPNTFKYKSHPNAKTKARLEANKNYIREEASGDFREEGDNDYLEFPEEQKLPDFRMYGKKLLQNFRADEDHNTTPEWMPKELNEQWISANSLDGFNKEREMPDFTSSVRITRPSTIHDDLGLNLPVSSSETMIHNSNPSANATPMWKKAAKEYQTKRKSQPQLQHIFLSLDSAKSLEISENLDVNKSVNNDKGGELENHMNSASSTLSTPMASMSNRSELPSSLTKDQIDRIENILKNEAEGKPNDYLLHIPNPDSPLKLFGDKYNTFTKGKLTDILQKLNSKSSKGMSPKNSSEKKGGSTKKGYDSLVPASAKPAHSPLLKIKNFTKSGTYTEEQFLQNANNIFNNIQKRGLRMKRDSDLTQGIDRTASNLHPQTTVTSTPKISKVADVETVSSQDDISSFTSDFDEDSDFQKRTSPEVIVHRENEYTIDQSNYTANIVGTNYKGSSPKKAIENGESYQNTNQSSYTFDEGYFTETNNGEQISEPKSNEEQADKPVKPDFKAISARLDELEKILKEINIASVKEDMKRLKEENMRLKKEIQNHRKGDDSREALRDTSQNFYNIDEANYQRDDFIKWKRASQLRLRNQSSLNGSPIKAKKNNSDDHIVRGTVEPNLDLPVRYENMILDVENKKWIPSDDKENDYLDTLGSIEDLVSLADEKVHSNERKFNRGSILGDSKENNSEKKTGNTSKLEVSFNLPYLSSEENSITKNARDGNVTHVSQIDDLTFSQTRKKLVSVITDLFSSDVEGSHKDWEEEREVSLQDRNLESVKDLSKFLPKVRALNISNNYIKFLEGIPSKILDLNASHNALEDMTPFADFRDLQRLNISGNFLSNLSGLKQNIHLTELICQNNRLISTEGLQRLVNLTKLELSQNEIDGEMNFKKFDLKNLQELNISENSLRSITGLENLPKLRVLNVNDNNLTNVSCDGKHTSLKKLLVKFNNLKKLNVSSFPFLRTLRLDGNNFESPVEVKRLSHLEEISCKSQCNKTILRSLVNEANDVHTLDLSGNSTYPFVPDAQGHQLARDLGNKPFLNLNRLILSAINLVKIPTDFSTVFPNVRELNLNFNRLKDINGLAKMQNLKKVYLVSNCISELEMVANSLIGSRNSLKMLDLRLNPVNLNIYPFVFNPQELDYINQVKDDVSEVGPIHLESVDDIESFAIHYQSILRQQDDWIDRDAEFYSSLSKDVNNPAKYNRRLNYEIFLIMFFHHLRRLDGGIVSQEKRLHFKRRLATKNIPTVDMS